MISQSPTVHLYYIDKYLTVDDLESLPFGTRLNTLDANQSLFVTTDGNGKTTINNVRIQVGEVVKNSNVVVHKIGTPFPVLHEGFDQGGSMTPPINDELWGIVEVYLLEVCVYLLWEICFVFLFLGCIEVYLLVCIYWKLCVFGLKLFSVCLNVIWISYEWSLK